MNKTFLNLKKILNKKGFSFIELIVVIAIIAIIAAMAMPDISKTVSESKVTRATGDIKVIAEAVQKYYADTGSLLTDGSIAPNSANCTTLKGTATGADGFTKGPWLKTCPIGPWSGKEYMFENTATTDNPANFDVTITDGTISYKFSTLGNSGS